MESTDHPGESFAKAATKHWFRDLISGRSLSKRMSVDAGVINTARTAKEQYDLAERVQQSRHRSRSTGSLQFSKTMTFTNVDHPAGLLDEKEGSYSIQEPENHTTCHENLSDADINQASSQESKRARVRSALTLEDEVRLLENSDISNEARGGSTSNTENQKSLLAISADLVDPHGAANMADRTAVRNEETLGSAEMTELKHQKMNGAPNDYPPDAADSDDYYVVLTEDLIPMKRYRRRRKTKENADRDSKTKNSSKIEKEIPQAFSDSTPQESETEKTATVRLERSPSNTSQESSQEVIAAEGERIITASAERLHNVFGLVIHRTDRLAMHSLVQSAVIRISVIDALTSDYMKKTKRSTTFYYESTRKDLDYILPTMTKICDIPKPSTSAVNIPIWEEQLVYNEEYSRISADNIVLFFELTEFVPSAKATNPSKKHKWDDASFKPIAWGFYKMQSTPNKVASGKKRLQLYLPISAGLLAKNPEKFPLVYRWYLTKIRARYPSTLYVTIMEAKIPDKVSPVLRSELPNQPEISRLSYAKLKSMLGSQVNLGTSSEPERSQYRSRQTVSDTDKNTSNETNAPAKRKQRASVRLPNQKCLTPNNVHMEIPTGQEGATVAKFSRNGRNIALACIERQNVTFVQINDVRTGIVRGRLYGCRGTIYELDWNQSDSNLLAASADGTAKIWNTESCHPNCLISLPHPGFVYTAKFHPVQQHIIATGCFDGVIRIWKVFLTGDYLLMAELTSHSGFINSLLFDEPGNKLFSSGSDGYVKVWLQDGRVTKDNDDVASWSPLQELLIPSNTASGITDLKPILKRAIIVAFTQDGEFHFIDTTRLMLTGSLVISAPGKHRLRGAVTPCGTHVYIPVGKNGSEASDIAVISLNSGKQEHVIKCPNGGTAVLDVDFHPSEHMLAYCGLGYRRKLIIMNHFKEFVELTAGPAHPLSRQEYKRDALLVIKVPKGIPLMDSETASTVQSEKIAIVIEKLNEITKDLKSREELTMSAGDFNRNSSTESRENFGYISSSRNPQLLLQPQRHRGFMPNFSQL